MSGSRRISWVMIVVLFLAPLPVLPQQKKVDIPKTLAGDALGKLVDALNSDDEGNWKQFIDQNWAPSDQEGAMERRMMFFQRVHADVGGLDIYKIEDSKAFEVSALTHAKNPESDMEWLLLTVYLDSLPPHKINRLSARPGDDPTIQYPESPLTDEKISSFVDSYVKGLVAKDRFSGTVLVAKDGKPIYKGVFGEACKRYNVPNKLDTRFNLGSMNKMFTGVAIMQLVEQGKVKLDDPVGVYLPDLPRKEIAEKVTIDHLLSHRSGMQDYWEEMFDTTFWMIKTVDGLASLIFKDTLLFEPGTDFHYSNSGPIVLGMVIEKVTGQDYYDYVLEHICKPAGMINTDCYEVDRPEPNVAIGYTKVNYDGSIDPGGKWRNNFFLHAVKGGPAGGGYSTVEDLLAFDIALRRNKLISKESFENMITPRSDRSSGSGYGYLFGNREVGGQHIVGHGGGAPGINAVLDMYLESGYTVAVMANYDGAAGRVADVLEKLLTQQ
jgi:CubicO group peptidase (beta-lactamase class C family)